MTVSLVIFDLDGTLIDSAADLAHAVNAMLAAFGRAALPVSRVRGMIGDGMAKLVARALEASALADVDPAEAQQVFLRSYAADPLLETTAYPGASEALARLRAAGLPLAVCTNKPVRLAEIILERLDLARFFARVIGGDSLPYRKPDPRILQSLLRAFDVAPADALLVGDSEVDAATASAAGVPLVLMTYGYRREPVERMACLAALDRFEALPAMIATVAGRVS